MDENQTVGHLQLKVNELNGSTHISREVSERILILEGNKKATIKQKHYTLENIDDLKIHIKVEPGDFDEQEPSALRVSDGLYNRKHSKSSLVCSPALDLSKKPKVACNTDGVNESSTGEMQGQSHDEMSQSDQAENECEPQDSSVLSTLLNTKNEYQDESSISLDDSVNDLLPQRRSRGTYQCGICGLKFTGNYKLNRHMVTHTGAKPFECDICGSKFTRKERLTNHVKKHVIGKAERCKIYNKPYRRQAKLSQHRKITSSLEDKFIMSSDNTMEATPLSHIECAPDKLDDNGRVDDGCPGPLIKCNPSLSPIEAGSTSVSKDSESHGSPSLIDSGMQNLESLACMMIETLQRPKKSFKCDVCGLQFRGSYKFNRHKLIHTGEKPFECGICHAKFTRRERLTAHMKKHETDMNQMELFNEGRHWSITEIKSERQVQRSNLDLNLVQDTQLVDVTLSSEAQRINDMVKSEKDSSQASPPNNNTMPEAELECIPQEIKSLPKRKKHCSTKLHKCDLCDKVFSGTYKLNRHKATHTGEKPFQCLICFTSFARKDRFTCHVKKHMLTSQDKFDEISRFADSTILKEREEEYSNEITDTNDNCNELVKDSDVKLECDVCGKTVKNDCGLIRHKRIHFEKRQYNCEICSKQFFKKYSLSRHMTTHTDVRPFICHLCGLGFPLFYKLNRHLRSHNEKPVIDDVWKCEICGFIFKKEETLQRHKLLHFGGKPYTCDACDKGFSSYRSLSMHKAVVHFQTKPFKCDKCEVSYAYKGDLTRHKLIHTGSKPYRCCICGKAFEHTFKLTRHKKIHDVLRPFHCSVCGKGFLEITKHNKHLKSHANDKM